MELTFNKNKGLTHPKKVGYWNDFLIKDFYLTHYNKLNSKEFDKDIKLLTNVLIKLPASKRKAFMQVLSRFVEFYITNKIEKEINGSLLKMLKF